MRNVYEAVLLRGCVVSWSRNVVYDGTGCKIFESHRRTTGTVTITKLFCIKWPFYRPPPAYLIRTDYAITVVNSIPRLSVVVVVVTCSTLTSRKTAS